MRGGDAAVEVDILGAALRAFGSDEDFRGGVGDDPAAGASQSVSNAYIGRICV